MQITQGDSGLAVFVTSGAGALRSVGNVRRPFPGDADPVDRLQAEAQARPGPASSERFSVEFRQNRFSVQPLQADDIVPACFKPAVRDFYAQSGKQFRDAA